MASWILGIASSHDGAFCLLKDGVVQVAIREERLCGLKHARVYAGRKSLGLAYCLRAAGITVDDLDLVVVATQSSNSLEENDVTLNPELRSTKRTRRKTVNNHLAHAASALGYSGYESAAIMICDGAGSPVTDLDEGTRRCVRGPTSGAYEHLSLYHARSGQIDPIDVFTCTEWVEHKRNGMRRFQSLGGMFASVSEQIFGSLYDAGKVMGLAPYGSPSLEIPLLVRFSDRTLEFPNSVQELFKGSEMWPNSAEANATLAASAQHALEECLLFYAKKLRQTTSARRLCMAGGVALNSVANERVIREAGFDDVFVVPAADDAGTALGAAYLGYWETVARRAQSPVRVDAAGAAYSRDEIRSAVESMSGMEFVEPSDLVGDVIERLVRGEIGGWFQGGAELGPRALGRRSIIANPAFPNMKDLVNASVKFREPFRPFAPSVPEMRLADCFDLGNTRAESPFMLRVLPFAPDMAAKVPAVVHVDGTGRVQSLTQADNGKFYELVKRFGDATRVPMLLNTSMNLRNEPIAETPEDALWLLAGTALNFCVVGSVVVFKRSQGVNVLDHVPVVSAVEWRLRLPVERGRLERTPHHEEGAEIVCNTKWGRTTLSLSSPLLAILSLIDGNSDGRSLLARVTAFSGQHMTELDLAHSLLLLRRMHAINLVAPS